MNSLHRHLRVATRSDHMRLHELVDLKRMLNDLDGYYEMLIGYFYAISPAEKGLKDFDRSLLPEIGGRPWSQRFCKSQWLMADICDLSSISIAGFEDSNTTRLSNVAEFVGTSYMLEGMTLGNCHIARQIDKCLGDPLRELKKKKEASAPMRETDYGNFGSRFFAGHGAESDNNWLAYCQWLEQVAPIISFTAVENAARFAFQEFGRRFSASIARTRGD